MGYLHAINHSSAASQRSIARTRQNCSHLCQGICYRLVLPVAHIWAPQAPAQERRAPTVGAALLPTGSGLAPTRLLLYNTVTVGRAETRPCRGAATEDVPARKPTSVAYQQEYQNAYFCSTGRGNGAIRAFSDGYLGESIEDSRTEPQSRGKEEHKMHNSMCCWKLTCLLGSCDRDF